MGTKSDLHNNRLRVALTFVGIVAILGGVFLVSYAQPVLAQTGTGTPMVTGTVMASGTPMATAVPTGTPVATVAATAVTTAAPTAVPTLAPPQPTASSTALVPVTGADQGVQAAQQSLYVNLGIVTLGLVLVVIGILIRTNRSRIK